MFWLIFREREISIGCPLHAPWQDRIHNLGSVLTGNPNQQTFNALIVLRPTEPLARAAEDIFTNSRKQIVDKIVWSWHQEVDYVIKVCLPQKA